MEYFTDAKFRASRMFKDFDLESFEKHKYFAKYRPRGILSGLLVIKDNLSPAEFIQPNKPKLNFLFRFHECLTKKGPMIFLAYLSKNKDDNSFSLIIEDLFLFENTNLFLTMDFESRWKKVETIFTSKDLFVQDIIISNNIKIKCAEHVSLADLEKYNPLDQVIEMIPNNKALRRIIILLEKEDNSQIFIAEKIIGKGPDLFFLKKDDEYLEKIAGIQSIIISKLLRKLSTAKVKCIYNEKFEKYIITEIIG